MIFNLINRHDKLINPSIFHRMQTWSSNMYVVIAVFFEEKRTHLVYFTWAHFFYYGKMNLWSNFFFLFYLDDNDNCWWLKQCFFNDFFDIRVRIAGTSIFIFFFSFFFNLEKSVKYPQIWASIMWVCLFMKVRRAELYDLIFPKHNGEKYFLREHSWFFIYLTGVVTV